MDMGVGGCSAAGVQRPGLAAALRAGVAAPGGDAGARARLPGLPTRRAPLLLLAEPVSRHNYP